LCEELENQVKDGHKSLESALDKIGELEQQIGAKATDMESLRKKLTDVATLFEKKEIKQKYSFEVLCDFIYDKANRLF
jgi:chromosome segregation ATPase